jgi:hypothetical protein
MHASHLGDYVPELMRYLALPPGWRVLLAPGQVDVWFDQSITAVEYVTASGRKRTAETGHFRTFGDAKRGNFLSDATLPSMDQEVIRCELRSIVDGSADPYDAGRRVWSAAFERAEHHEEFWALWLLWGALTDWIESKPSEVTQAHESMRRASREWLELGDDQPTRRKYFDRWLYDEMGYERKSRSG